MKKAIEKPNLAIFEGKKIRRVWDEENEKWWFSIIDVVYVLTNSPNARTYWRVLKSRLKKEGSQVVTKCNDLKLLAPDGKYYLTDCADTETVFRILQTIPSSNAEPFKLWLARVGYERVEESQDPELAISRALRFYRHLGRGDDWINQRLKSIEIRKDLTDEWGDRGIKEGLKFAILTDEITRAWAGIKTRDYKNLKGLKTQNLRDHMSNLELVLNMLAEVSTTKISQKEKPLTLKQSRKVARRGGNIAGLAREKLEKETGQKVINSENFLLEKK